MDDGTTKQARAGDTKAAREILEDFVAVLDQYDERIWKQHGGPIHYAHARYLADVFGQILGGVEPGKALGVAPGEPGRPGGSNKYDEVALLGAHYYLCSQGYGSEKAKEQLSAMLADDGKNIASTIEKMSSKKFGIKPSEGHKYFAENVLKAMMAPYADTVSKILQNRKITL